MSFPDPLDSLKTTLQTHLDSSLGAGVNVLSVSQRKARGKDIVAINVEMDDGVEKFPILVRTGDQRVLEFLKTGDDSQLQQWLNEIHGSFEQFQADRDIKSFAFNPTEHSLKVTTNNSGKVVTHQFKYIGGQEVVLEGLADKENQRITEKEIEAKIQRRENRKGIKHKLKTSNAVKKEINALQDQLENTRLSHEAAKVAHSVLEVGGLISGAPTDIEAIREKMPLDRFLVHATAKTIKELDLFAITAEEVHALPLNHPHFTYDKLVSLSFRDIIPHVSSVDFTKFVARNKGPSQEELSIRFAIFLTELFKDEMFAPKVASLGLDKLSKDQRIELFRKLDFSTISPKILAEFKTLFPGELNVPLVDAEYKGQLRIYEIISLLEQATHLEVDKDALKKSSKTTPETIDYIVLHLVPAMVSKPDPMILENAIKIIDLLQNHPVIKLNDAQMGILDDMVSRINFNFSLDKIEEYGITFPSWAETPSTPIYLLGGDFFNQIPIKSIPPYNILREALVGSLFDYKPNPDTVAALEAWDDRNDVPVVLRSETKARAMLYEMYEHAEEKDDPIIFQNFAMVLKAFISTNVISKNDPLFISLRDFLKNKFRLIAEFDINPVWLEFKKHENALRFIENLGSDQLDPTVKLEMPLDQAEKLLLSHFDEKNLSNSQLLKVLSTVFTQLESERNISQYVEWVRSDKDERAALELQKSNVKRSVLTSSWLSKKVLADIFQGKDVDKSSVENKIFKYIELLEQLTLENNLEAGMAIYTVLRSSTISRIMGPYMNEKTQKRIQKLANIYESDRNYSGYRANLKYQMDRGEDVLPFTGLNLTDLTFKKDGNTGIKVINDDNTFNYARPHIFDPSFKSFLYMARSIQGDEWSPDSPLLKSLREDLPSLESQAYEDRYYNLSLSLFPRK